MKARTRPAVISYLSRYTLLPGWAGSPYPVTGSDRARPPRPFRRCRRLGASRSSAPRRTSWRRRRRRRSHCRPGSSFPRRISARWARRSPRRSRCRLGRRRWPMARRTRAAARARARGDATASAIHAGLVTVALSIQASRIGLRNGSGGVGFGVRRRARGHAHQGSEQNTHSSPDNVGASHEILLVDTEPALRKFGAQLGSPRSQPEGRRLGPLFTIVRARNRPRSGGVAAVEGAGFAARAHRCRAAAPRRRERDVAFRDIDALLHRWHGSSASPLRRPPSESDKLRR